MFRTPAVLLLITLLCSGCRGFDLNLPNHFVELPQRGPYAVRSVNADGVVLAVRVVHNDPAGSLDFWSQAVQNRVHSMRGYKLLKQEALLAASGEKIQHLRFGRDEAGQPYQYWVWICTARDSVYVLEAGGREEKFLKVQADLESAVQDFEVEFKLM